MAFTSVLCDLDGTLTDSEPGITNCIRYALKSLGMKDVPSEHLRWTLGPPIQKSFEILLSTSDPGRIQTAVDRYRERFEAIGWKENSVYHGIPDALSQLRRANVRLFVATSKPRVFAERILAHFDLNSHFDQVYGSELDGTRSNKAQLLSHLLAEEKLNPKHCLMIGDREHDVNGAKANQIPCLGVTYGYGSAHELTSAGAIGLANTPSEWTPFVLGSAGTL